MQSLPPWGGRVVKISGPVEEAIFNVLKSDNLRSWIYKIINEEVVRITDDTDLISAVVKAPDEQRANQAMTLLKSKGMDARVKFPIRMNPSDTQEPEGWGVLVRNSDIVNAGDILSSDPQDLVFDPYLKTARK